MIQAAKIIGTGLATTGLIGAGVGTGVVFGVLLLVAYYILHLNTRRLKSHLFNPQVWWMLNFYKLPLLFFYLSLGFTTVFTIFMCINFFTDMSFTIYCLDHPSANADTVSIISETGSAHDFQDDKLLELASKQDSGTLSRQDIIDYAQDRRDAASSKRDEMINQLIEDNTSAELNSEDTLHELIADERSRAMDRIQDINASEQALIQSFEAGRPLPQSKSELSDLIDR